MMRVAELILVQPDGKIKRLVITSEAPSEAVDAPDERMIRSLCDAMMDHGFRSKLAESSRQDAVESLGLGIYSKE